MEYAIPLLIGVAAFAVSALGRIARDYRRRRASDKHQPQWYLGECVPVETDRQRADRERALLLQSIFNGNEGRI